MTEQNKQKNPLVAILISVIVVAIIVVWALVKPKSAEPINQERANLPDYNQPLSDRPASGSVTGQITESSGAKTEPFRGLRPALIEVINAAKTWGPGFESWLGKAAPDFTLTDLNGKQHILSAYRGKDVMLVFWASWCGPCRMEIPHLIELRKTISPDKLEILAISFIDPRNTTEIVKSFLEQNNEINYTVLSVNSNDMPAPYNMVNTIPCSFFIDPQGKIKLATIGLLSLKDMMAILQAK
jgi:thiol-disulfide isomerase/thioredoxin